MKQRNSPSVSEMGDRVYFMTVAACLETGLSLDIMAEGVAVPVLGVCLGMQALAHAVGASVVRAPEPVHGRLSNIRHDGHPLFRGIPSGAYLWWCPAALHQLGVPGWRRGKLLSRSFYVLAGPTGRYSVVRYHSLVVDETTLPTSLPAIAWTCGGHQAVRPALGDRGVGAQPSALQGNGDVVMAVAHSQLCTIYAMLKNGTTYVDLGGDHFEHRDTDRLSGRLVNRLQRLGFKVTIEPVPTAATAA